MIRHNVIIDFAENFVSTHSEKSLLIFLHFNKNSATPHTVVVHYKRNVQDEEHEEDLGCLYYTSILDDRAHNASIDIVSAILSILKKRFQPSLS